MEAGRIGMGGMRKEGKEARMAFQRIGTSLSRDHHPWVNVHSTAHQPLLQKRPDHIS